MALPAESDVEAGQLAAVELDVGIGSRSEQYYAGLRVPIVLPLGDYDAIASGYVRSVSKGLLASAVDLYSAYDRRYTITQGVGVELSAVSPGVYHALGYHPNDSVMLTMTTRLLWVDKLIFAPQLSLGTRGPRAVYAFAGVLRVLGNGIDPALDVLDEQMPYGLYGTALILGAGGRL